MLASPSVPAAGNRLSLLGDSWLWGDGAHLDVSHGASKLIDGKIDKKRRRPDIITVD